MIYGVAYDHFGGRGVLVRLMVEVFGTFLGVEVETNMFTTMVHLLITELHTTTLVVEEFSIWCTLVWVYTE